MSGLSREDRARLEVLGQYVDCEVALRALALIDQQEKALEAARDGLQRIADHDWTEPPADMPDEMAREALARVYSARATSTKGERWASEEDALDGHTAIVAAIERGEEP